jgi:hypothetical protein
VDLIATAKIVAILREMKREKVPWNRSSRETLRLSSRKYLRTLILILRDAVARSLGAKRSIASVTKVEFFVQTSVSVMAV